MSDAVAAPVAAPAAAPATAAPAVPAAPQAATPKPAPAAEPHLAKRGPDGKFVGNADAQPPAVAPETPKQAAERRRYNLKVDGREEALELSDDEVAIRLQKATASEKRFKEARQAQERAQRLLEAVRANPFEAMQELGVDVVGLTRQRLAEAARLQMLSPEERAAHEREQQLAQREARIRQAEETHQQAQVRAQEESAFQQAQRALLPALKESGLPQTHATLRMLAQAGYDALEAGVELTPQQLAAEVRSQLEGHARTYLQGLPPERAVGEVAPLLQQLPAQKLAEVLGPATVRALLQHTVEEARKRGGGLPPSQAKPAPEVPEEKPQEYLRPAEALRKLGL